MRVVFAGTPEFARVALDALVAAGHTVVGVLTQPDRAAGRGMKSLASPVKRAAGAAGIPVRQPRSLRLDGRYPEDARAARAALTQMAPDVMVVAAYGLILPQWVLDLPRLGCLNIHASLLPRWRGAAPIQRAIEAGDVQTGITIMQMDAGLDTGDMLYRVVRPIGAGDTAGILHDGLAGDGARAIVSVLDAYSRGDIPEPVPQPGEGVCYADKLKKSESELDFNQPAAVLARRVRAFNPFPGSTMMLPGLPQPLKVWAALALPAASGGAPAGHARPGTVIEAGRMGIDVATADGVLRLTEVQRPGKKRQPVSQFIQGWTLPKG